MIDGAIAKIQPPSNPFTKHVFTGEWREPKPGEMFMNANAVNRAINSPGIYAATVEDIMVMRPGVVFDPEISGQERLIVVVMDITADTNLLTDAEVYQQPQHGFRFLNRKVMKRLTEIFKTPDA